MSGVIAERDGRAAYLLAPSAYRDRPWFERERARLFTARWTLIAAEHELASPGTYVAATLGDAPIVVVRDDDGALHAFHNFCRHRGMMLLADGVGDCGGSITCFYHRWRYGLDGALKLVPQRKEQFPGLDVTQWGLLPASVGVWEGMVFAHPDPHAKPLADFVAPLAANIGSFRPGALRQVAHVELEARCNWKLFVENHIDVYHLWYLHESTLGDFDHTRFEHHNVEGNWFSYEPQRDESRRPSLTAGTTAIAHLNEHDRVGLGAHLLFPSLMVATSTEFFATYQAVPIAPDRTRIELRIRAESSANPEALIAATRSFIEEDIGACERVQAALAAPAFAVGPLAVGHEAPIARFHEHLLSRLGVE
jgi:phenylpropionate dioxygenase-like ring-hydroxylating dioxygenase large terminal subunit